MVYTIQESGTLKDKATHTHTHMQSSWPRFWVRHNGTLVKSELQGNTTSATDHTHKTHTCKEIYKRETETEKREREREEGEIEKVGEPLPYTQ